MFQIKKELHLRPDALDAKIKDPGQNGQHSFPGRSALHNHTNGIQLWRPPGRQLPIKKRLRSRIQLKLSKYSLQSKNICLKMSQNNREVYNSADGYLDLENDQHNLM